MSETSPESLFARSVIVTGTHYSATTLVGRMLECAPEFHLLHEPTNAAPTLGFDSTDPPHWYEFYDADRHDELRAALTRYLTAEGFVGEVARRFLRIRQPRHVLEVGRYVERKLPFLRARKPAIFKDPFLAFSARTLQQADGLKVVLTVRHPCGFAESFARKVGVFDFSDFLQPALLEALPEEAETIARFAREPQPELEQAALLWRVVYGFAARYLLDDPRTHVVRQDDLALDPDASLDALLAFLGVPRNPAFDAFIEENLRAEAADFSGKGSYYKRNAKETLGKWRERLGPGQQASVRAMTEEVAARFGYDAGSW